MIIMSTHRALTGIIIAFISTCILMATGKCCVVNHGVNTIQVDVVEISEAIVVSNCWCPMRTCNFYKWQLR